KDALIEAVEVSHTPGHVYAYWCVFLGVFITAFYSFRLVFMTFHGEERFGHDSHGHAHDDGHGHADAHAHHDDKHGDSHGDHGAHGGKPHESPWFVTLPLILLAIPSLFIGWFTIGPVLFGDYFNGAIFVSETHNVLGHIGEEFHGPMSFLVHAMTQAPVYLAL